MEAFRSMQESYIRGTMDEWWRSSNSISILITGKTGTGKSSLVNAILGKDVAKVGETVHPETSEVTSFQTNSNGIEVTVWDSPGLQDGLKKESAYLSNIESRCKDKIDLFIYCVSMDNARFLDGSRDIDSMCMLTEKLGKTIWNNAVFILTCANRYISSKRSMYPETDDDDYVNKMLKETFDKRLEEWRRKIKQCLLQTIDVPAETVEKLPILPAGRKGLPMLLKGYRDTLWLSKIWIESLLVTKHGAQPALVKMNLNRLASASDIRSEEEFTEVLKKEKIIIEERGTDIGRGAGAEQAGKNVGRVSGKVACMAHLIERIYSNIPNLTVRGTTIVVNEELGIIAARVVCELS